MSIGELPRELGRYDLFDQIAAGGMASVHFGRMHGAVGFQRVVAIKRLHAHYAHDAHFVDMFLDEARLASRLKHPNVIQTLDVVADEREVFLVMEFVLGESLEALMPKLDGRPIPLPVVSAIVCNVLEGLHGAHDATSDAGEPLGIVHRDVSPPNVLVGDDGVARVFDFGIAKAAINTQETRDGVIKGKVTYMAPEQVIGTVDRRTDIYAAGVILWELLVARRRHAGQKNDALFIKLATNAMEPLRSASELRLDAPPAIDAIIARATSPNAVERYATGREMAMAIEAVIRPAPAREVADWVRSAAGARIDRLAEAMKRIEQDLVPTSERSLLVASRAPSSVRVMTSLTGPGVVASVPPGVAPTPIPPPRRSWTMPVALIAFTAALLLVGLRVLGNRGGPVPREPDAPSTSANVTNARVGAPPAEPLPAQIVADATPPVETTMTAALPKPAAPVWRPQVHVAPAVQTVAPASPVVSAPTTASSPPHKTNCDNPFVVGPDGIRAIKPECM